MSKKLSLLIVEDSVTAAKMVVHCLEAAGYKVSSSLVEDIDSISKALSDRPEERWDALICDYIMDGFTALDVLAMFKESGLDLPFIIISGKIDEETAVAAMKAGAHDYISKEKMERLVPALERELKDLEARRENRRKEEELKRYRNHLEELVDECTEALKLESSGRSKAAQEVDRFFSISSDLLCIASTDGYFKRLNPAWEGVLGYTVDEILAKPYMELIHPDDREATVAEVERQLKGSATLAFVNRYRAKDGSYRTLSWRGHASEEGLLYASARDITESRRVEEKLAATLHYFKSMNRVNEALEYALDTDEILSACLSTILEIFSGDRAWLLYPCDLNAPEWTVPYQVTRPEYAVTGEVKVASNEISRNVFKKTLETREPATFLFDSNELPPGESGTDMVKQFTIRSQIVMALHPKVGSPWLMGLHQCSHKREWTKEEEMLFRDVALRMTDALNVMLSEDALKENQARLQLSLDVAGEGTWTWDIKSGLVVWDDRMQRIFGFEPGEFDGSLDSWKTCIHPEDLAATEEATLKAMRNASRYAFEYRVRGRLPGEWLYVYAQAVTSTDAEGRPVSMIGVCRDITDRKKAEAAVRDSEARLKAITSSANDAIVLSDDKGSIAYWNPAAEKVFGYSAKEAIGMSLGSIIKAEVISDGECDVGKVTASTSVLDVGAQDGCGGTSETTGTKKDGTEFAIELSLSCACVGDRLHAIYMIRDISARKEAEEKLAKNIDETTRMNRLMVGREIKMEALRNEIKALIEENNELRDRLRTTVVNK